MVKGTGLGELALERGFLTREELEDALGVQARLFQEGTDRPLGEILVEKGYIRQAHLEALLRAQKERGRKRIGPYDLLSRLGEGGMAAVYKACDRRTGGLVALKILPRRLARDAEYVRRFEREGRLGLKLDHPNVVRTLEVGQGEGPGGASYHYMAIEYIEGPDLEQVLEERSRLPEREALGIALATARALQHAQENELVHRDIKPANIMLARDGRIMLADLGLARSTAEDATRFTLTGTALGTPNYISPEQARGERDIDVRTDIYSLGATLYSMLTGQAPFEGGTAAVVVARHLTEELPNPRDIVPELSDAVCRLVERMMAKRREGRHAGPAELMADIERVLGGAAPTKTLEPGLSSIAPPEARAHTGPGEPGRPAARRRAPTVRVEPAKGVGGERGRLLRIAAGAACAAFLVGIAAGLLRWKEEPSSGRARPPDPVRGSPHRDRGRIHVEAPSSREAPRAPQGGQVVPEQATPPPAGAPQEEVRKAEARPPEPEEGADDAFQQEAGPDGIVCMEAEHYHNALARGGHSWTESHQPGCSGGAVMLAAPNPGSTEKEGYQTRTAQMDYRVNFTKTGTHYVWVRGWAETASDDSCHVGLDGAAIPTCDKISNFRRYWTWSTWTMDGLGATFNVGSTGLHTVNVWMREDGFIIDKLVITANPGYRPPRMGPPETRADRTAPRPAGPVEFEGHAYWLFVRKVNWHEAKLSCEDQGGHLVTIASEEENSVVVGLAREARVDAWIGLSDERDEGHWEWVTGEEVVFTGWTPGEPNNLGDQDYVYLWKKGGFWWDDEKRDKTASFICEWDTGVPGLRVP